MSLLYALWDLLVEATERTANYLGPFLPPNG